MTYTEDYAFEIEVYYIPSLSEGGKQEYVGCASSYEDAEELVIEDCAEYYGTEDHRDTSNYKFIKNCEDITDITDKEESWSNSTIEEVSEFVSNSEPPMSEGEFHRWANPSLIG